MQTLVGNMAKMSVPEAKVDTEKLVVEEKSVTLNAPSDLQPEVISSTTVNSTSDSV